jgi:hypothetical protein
MASERSPGQGENSNERADIGGKLVSIYEEYVGQPASQEIIYVGFGLFFAGIALGFFGLILFFFSGMQPTESEFFWQFRESALAFAMLAIPSTVLGIVVLLSVGRRTLGTGIAGAIICIGAATWMTRVYPYQWTNANDVSVITTYSVGLVLLTASTGSALVAQYVESAAPQETETADTEDDSVTDEEVAEDIEDAVSDTTLTWGGVEKQPETKRLKFNMPETGQEIDDAEVTPDTETRASGEDVDTAVEGLRKLQGGEQEMARSNSPDDQVESLSKLRDRQEADDLETGVETDRGLLAWVRQRLFG